MKKNLFPLFLDGATQVLSAASAATWDGKTSFVTLANNGIGTFTLGEVAEGNEPIEPGTVVSVYRSASGTTNIGVLPKAGESALLGLNGATESAVFMWDASAWKIVSNATASGSVSTTNLALTGTLSVAGAATLAAAVKLDVSSTATVAEATNRATGVTLSQVAGVVSTNAASLADTAEATLTVTNTVCTANSVVIVSPGANCNDLGGGAFEVTPAAGSFTIVYKNVSGGAVATAQTFRFVVINLT